MHPSHLLNFLRGCSQTPGEKQPASHAISSAYTLPLLQGLDSSTEASLSAAVVVLEFTSVAVDVLEIPSVADVDEVEAADEDKRHEIPVSRLSSSKSLPLTAQRVAGPFETAYG